MTTLYDASMIAIGGFDLALDNHMAYRCYPPVHSGFKDAILDAIETCAYEDDGEIELPNGRVLMASDIVEQLHLHAFVFARQEELAKIDQEMEQK